MLLLLTVLGLFGRKKTNPKYLTTVNNPCIVVLVLTIQGFFMTMHLARGLTTTSTKQRKRKITKADLEKYTEDCRLFNKRMKQAGRHDERLTLDEYIDFCHGKIKSRPKVEQPFEVFKPSSPFRRETKYYPSLSNGIGVATKPEPMKYTGTLIKGIATMHKSNAVPVIDEEHAKDISRMRRG